MTLVNIYNSKMAFKIRILSNFVTKQLLIEYISYDWSIDVKGIKFGAYVELLTLI